MLEDIEEIKRLKARYCAYCDDEFDADRNASLFTEDAVWDGGMRGKAEGREAIRSFFSLAPEGLSFARHMVMNPVIQVEGDTANASWYLLECCTYGLGNQAVWGAVRSSWGPDDIHQGIFPYPAHRSAVLGVPHE